MTDARDAIARIQAHNLIQQQKEPGAFCITETLDAVIEALEKQIPKKPIKCCPLNDQNEMLDENEYYKCPACGLKFRKTYEYCHYCGQRLDWRESDVR